MRTNIDIDDTIIKEAMQLAHITTKREIIRLALTSYIGVLKRKKILDMEGKAPWIADLAVLRER